MVESKPQPLFGGCIGCVFPVDMVDVSTLRQVPDHQEVRVRVEGEPLRQTMIVDLLEMVSEPDMDKALTHHLKDLMLSLEPEQGQELSRQLVPIPKQVCEARLGKGSRVMSCTHRLKTTRGRKGTTDESEAEIVYLHLALLRVPRATSDIVVSVTTPVAKVNDTVPEGQDLFRAAVGTFAILDWGLFGEGV
ncbi:Ran-interacting Mog1 protein [Kipferlia bialata]|uniref:Ran-interacting Mog1 protein n=1 Tax=Kipferlia bialata TaxID=797122 RepID=A0A9K3CUB5_9EUKA|nr:Ran-interacting Mog1 protein [Kipferlia bialata]|eukprot:g3607.t1